MDVGADEFEQSLPLLQELVLGADFVGEAPASRALWPEPQARSSLGRGWRGWDGWGGGARPGRTVARPREAQRGPLRGTGTVLPGPGPWDVKQQLPL